MEPAMEPAATMSEPDTHAMQEPVECECFPAMRGFRHLANLLIQEPYDPALVAGICFAMMGLIVLIRVVQDLLARLFGWG